MRKAGAGAHGSADDSEIVRVVCVTYDPGPVLATFLDSLHGATDRPVDVVLADNGSADGWPEREARRPEVTIRRTGGNLGYGKAANIGAEGFDGTWLVVANPDIEWLPGSLERLIRTADRWPRAGALGPKILEPDGTVYPSGRSLPSLRVGAGHAIFAQVWPGNPWTARYQRRHELVGDAERVCGWLSGSCLLLRMDAFRSVGGFDPAYFMFFEDVDLGDRLGREGWQSVYVPSSEVIHVGGHSWRAAPEAMIRAHHDSAVHYLTSRYTRWYQAPLRAAVAAGLAIREQAEIRSSHRRRTDSGRAG